MADIKPSHPPASPTAAVPLDETDTERQLRPSPQSPKQWAKSPEELLKGTELFREPPTLGLSPSSEDRHHQGGLKQWTKSPEELLKGTKPIEELPPLPDAEALPQGPAFLTPVLQLALALGLVTALFAAAQAAVLYNQLALLPGWLRPLGYALLIVVILVLLYFGGKLVWVYGRLRVSPHLSLPLDEDLQERALARQQLSTEHLAAARQTLTHFLKAYPLRPGDLAELTHRGLEPMAHDTLRAAQYALTGPNAPADDREWLRRFEQEFLGPLDAAAGQQTWRYMKAVGLFTATSSRGALDALAVLVVSYKLVADLCTIYHVRAGRWGTTMILAHVLVNLVAASQLDAATDTTESIIHDWLHSSLAHLASRVLGKVADGSVNALLLRRLSLCTQAYLRPVRKAPGPLQLSP
jgi:uncharacterized membrane protein YcjF (UPF0283 family)